MNNSSHALQKGDGLCLVDVQNDFCPGGALAVNEGDQVIPVLNRFIKRALEIGVPVYASRDWHPSNHISFKDQGGPWPPHCVQDTKGASFRKDLELPQGVIKITKGVRFDKDQNSVFDQTGLADQLKRDGVVGRLWVGGLAQDVCVLASVLDGRKAGFQIYVIERATRPVTDESGRQALEEMKNAGAVIIE